MIRCAFFVLKAFVFLVEIVQMEMEKNISNKQFMES